MKITLDSVTKRYGSQVALEPTTLAFAEERTTVLIGPSGCGKSTLLRMVVGLIAPDAGRVLVDGVAADRAALPSIRRRMGYVIQEGGLFPHLTARDNVTLMARELGWSRERIAARIEALLPLVRLDAGQLARHPAQLSGGQRQRVGLMRALMLEPELLLLDEPLGALDPMVRYDLQRDLRDVFESLSTSVILVTHDLGEAAYLGDTIVLMRDGRVVQSGTIGDLTTAPSDPFVTRFITAQRSPLEVLS
jgi:osmoprotectant transport system ATP-binding protein